MIRIIFEHETKSLGRNGFIRTIGIFVSRIGRKEIRIQTIAFKGKVPGRSWIDIHDEDVDKLIKVLKDYKEGAWI